MQNLFHLGFGRRRDPETAMIDIQLGLIDRVTGEYAINDEVNISFKSLLSATIGLGAINAVVGYLNGTAASMAELLTKDHITTDGGSIGMAFAACFIADAVAREIGQRWVRHQQKHFIQTASKWEYAEAMMDEGRGVWVVTQGDFKVPEGPVDKLAAIGEIVVKNNAAVLSEVEFREFEQRLAQAGGTLKTYRIDTEGNNATIMTKVGGRLQSINGDPAVQVYKDGRVVQEQWFDHGMRCASATEAKENEQKFGHLRDSQNTEGKVALLKLAQQDLRHAIGQLQRDYILEDEDRSVVRYVQDLVLSIDNKLRTVFGNEFEPVSILHLDISNLDGLLEWPKETAEKHRHTTIRLMECSIDRMATEALTMEEPELAFYAERIKAFLANRRLHSLQGRLGQHQDFDVAVRRLDDGSPAIEVVPLRDDMEPSPDEALVLIKRPGGYEFSAPGQDVTHIQGDPVPDVMWLLGQPDIKAKLDQWRASQRDEHTANHQSNTSGMKP
jgi:hypothetical protein